MTSQEVRLIAPLNTENSERLSLAAKVGVSLVWIRLLLTGESRRLLDLNKVKESSKIVGYHYVGLQSITLHQIRGSATTGRCRDFDANFRPLRDYSESRCGGIAAARRRGIKMPPVALIKVGQIYFVEDGHHRISVARAWEEQTIEAEVIVWRVAGPLPWENQLRRSN